MYPQETMCAAAKPVYAEKTVLGQQIPDVTNINAIFERTAMNNERAVVLRDRLEKLSSQYANYSGDRNSAPSRDINSVLGNLLNESEVTGNLLSQMADCINALENVLS